MIGDAFEEKIADCIVHGLPVGAAVNIQVSCRESRPEIPVGFVMDQLGYGYCAWDGITMNSKELKGELEKAFETIFGSIDKYKWYGSYKILVGECTK